MIKFLIFRGWAEILKKIVGGTYFGPNDDTQKSALKSCLKLERKKFEKESIFQGQIETLYGK